MSVSVNDGRKLLLNLVGTTSGFTHDDLMQKFRGIINVPLKSYVALSIRDKAYDIFDLDAHLYEFSDLIKQKLSSNFLDYGLNLLRFNIENIVGDRQYEDLKKMNSKIIWAKKEAEASAISMDIESEALKRKREREGYSYQTERSFDVAEKFAKNEGTGQYANLGVGLGMMAGVGNPMSNVIGNAVGGVINQNNGKQKFCPNCGSVVQENDKFCSNCGQKLIKE